MAKVRAKPPNIAMPQSLSVRYFDMDEIDVIWTMFIVSLSIFTITVFGWVPFGFVAVVFSALSLYRTNENRLYGLVADEAYNLYYERFKRGKLWQAKQGGGLPPVRPIIDEIVQKTDKGDNVSIGLHRLDNNGSYAIAVIATGSTITTESLQRQYRMFQQAVRKLRRMRKGTGISWVFDVNTPSKWTLAHYFQQSLNPFVAFPEAEFGDIDGVFPKQDQLTPAQRRHQTLHSLMQQVQKVDMTVPQEVTMGVVVTVTGNKLLAKSKGQMSIDKARALPALRIARNLVIDLKALGVTGAKIATADEMRRFHRGTWDSVDMTEFYDFQNEQQANGRSEGIKDGSDIPFHLPQKSVITARRGICFDGSTWVGVLLCTGLPEVMDPLSLLELRILDEDRQPINGRLATVSTTINVRSESIALNRMIPLIRTFESMFLSSGYRSTASRERDKTMTERESEVATSRFKLQNYRPIYIVKAPSLEKLREDMDRVSDVLGALDLEFHPVVGTSQLLRNIRSASGVSYM